MDNVLKMPIDNELTDQDIVNLFMGLVRLMRRQYQNRIDTLSMLLEEATTRLLQQQEHSPI